MAAIELYRKGTNYLQLRVTGLSGTYGYKRTYAWYIATSGTYKPNSPAASGTDSSTNAEQSPVATLSGLSAFTYYYVWCEIYLQGQSSPTTMLKWSGYTAAESKIDVYIKNFLDTSKALVDGKVSGVSGDTFLISAAGTQYQTYSQQYNFLYFRLSSQNYSTEHDASYPIPIQEGQTVKVYYQSKTTTIPIYNYLDGQHTLTDGSVSGTIGNSFFLSVSGTQYQTYSQEYEFQYFRLASEGYATNHAATETIPITSGQAVRVYYKTKITAVAPYISGVTLTKNTATVTWDKNGGGYGSWTLYWGKTSYTAIGSQSIGSSPVTVSGLDPGTTYYFWIVNKAGTDSKTSNTVSGDTKAQIAAFAWTGDDAAYIAAGKAVTYLTAASWNRMTAKINEVRAARGYGSISFTTAYAGQTITAAIYNEAANAIGNLTGAGSVSTVSAGTKLEATYFANSYSALKEALNRAISSYNG